MLQDCTPVCGNNKRKAPIWHLNARAQGPVPGKCWPFDFCCSQFFSSNTLYPTPSAGQGPALGIYVKYFYQKLEQGRYLTYSEPSLRKAWATLGIQHPNGFALSTGKGIRLSGLAEKCTDHPSFGMETCRSVRRLHWKHTGKQTREPQSQPQLTHFSGSFAVIYSTALNS